MIVAACMPRYAGKNSVGVGGAEGALQRVPDVGERPRLDVAVVGRDRQVREEAEDADVLEPARASPCTSNMPGAEWWPCSPPWRPIAHSTQSSGMPISRNETRYGIRNAPPPFCAACAGKRRKLPEPHRVAGHRQDEARARRPLFLVCRHGHPLCTRRQGSRGREGHVNARSARERGRDARESAR